VANNIFERLNNGRPPQNGSAGLTPQNPSIEHGGAETPVEDEQTRQERLEACLDALAADLRQFHRQT
jgi:hypothetical protein